MLVAIIKYTNTKYYGIWRNYRRIIWCSPRSRIAFRRHLKSIANQGMLADFVGMLTDSRSFLSYVRHDYFRRILCNLIGELVEDGEFEDDDRLLKEITAGICYRNIVNYLGLEDVE